MKTLAHFFGILFLGWAVFISAPALGAACDAGCDGPSDCSGNSTCAYCDSVCLNCCEVLDSFYCNTLTNCSWTSNECQNGGNSCGAVVPEVSRGFRYYFFGGLFLFSLGLTGVLARRSTAAPLKL